MQHAIYKKRLYYYVGEVGLDAILEDYVTSAHITVDFGDEHLIIDPTDDQFFAAKEFSEGLDRCADCGVVLDDLDEDGSLIMEVVDGETIHPWSGNLCTCGKDTCDDCYVALHDQHNNP